MKTLQDQIVEWHRATFPNATTKAIEDKLVEELEELRLVIQFANDSAVAEEIADVLIVSCALLDRYGLDLEQTVLDKLEINKGRECDKSKCDKKKLGWKIYSVASSCSGIKPK